MGLSREAALNHVTISTVGLGQDVNRAYLDKVATYAKGKSYFLNDPAGLEQILLKDVQEHTGTTAVEKALKPEILSKAELLDGVGMETAPPLEGYVRFDPKPSGDQILQTGSCAEWRGRKTRSSFVGSMVSAAPPSSVPMPRAVGHPLGWLGQASTSSGPT